MTFARIALLLAALPGALAMRADPIGPLGPHPRLLLTDAELTAALRAAADDPLRAALHARIVAAATADLSARPPVHLLKGPRLLDQSRMAIEQILTCSLAYRMTGDARFLERARRDLLGVSDFPDWNPSHFLDVAEMSFAVAIGYDWLYPELSPSERAIIGGALLGKALAFAPAAYSAGAARDGRLFWVSARMNWNQVCNGGMLAAALALGDERPDLAGLVVGGVRKSLPAAMGAYGPDGAYPEGPGYWSYGTTYNVIILALLDGTLGTDFGLGDTPAFDRTCRYRTEVEGPTGLVFNYADGGSSAEDTPAYAWLARRYSDEASLEHARVLLRREIDGRRHDRFLALHAAWFPAGVPGQKAGSEAPGPGGAYAHLPLAVHYRGAADIALLRSSWTDPGALFAGFKAGDNTTNHAHLDLGSFILESDGVRWAVDLGPDNYDLPGYFGARRWTYFRLNTRSHNTLTLADGIQDPGAKAPIIAFSDSHEFPYAVADLTAAYPGAAQRILRGVAMPGGSSVLVEDEFTALAAQTPVRWAMMTEAAVAISASGRSATLSHSGERLRAELLAPAGARFHVWPAGPPTPQENQNPNDSILGLETVSGTKAADLTICVRLTPLGERWPKAPPPPPRRLAAWH